MQVKGDIKKGSHNMRPKYLDKIIEAVHKPNSVLSNHLSWIPIARNLNRPTRESNEAGNFSSPIWSFSGRGFPCHLCHQRCGELLPRLFTLTPRVNRGGIFSVALSFFSRRLGITQRPAL